MSKIISTFSILQKDFYHNSANKKDFHHHICTHKKTPSYKLTFFFSLCFLLLHPHRRKLILNHHNMNGGNREENSFCYFHPKEVVVGVCPLCLSERLLILASKQGHLSSSRTHNNNKKKPSIILPKIFAFGSFLSRLEFRHWKSDFPDHDDVSISQEEDSFISIKFEDNGVASWEKNTISKSKDSLENCNTSWKDHSLGKEGKETKTVMEHGKPRGSLRWRKRIGHVFQVMRWKRSKSNKGNVCHVGSKVEGVKVRKGWIRTLTKRN